MHNFRGRDSCHAKTKSLKVRISYGFPQELELITLLVILNGLGISHVKCVCVSLYLSPVVEIMALVSLMLNVCVSLYLSPVVEIMTLVSLMLNVCVTLSEPSSRDNDLGISYVKCVCVTLSEPSSSDNGLGISYVKCVCVSLYLSPVVEIMALVSLMLNVCVCHFI